MLIIKWNSGEMITKNNLSTQHYYENIIYVTCTYRLFLVLIHVKAMFGMGGDWQRGKGKRFMEFPCTDL